MASSVFLYDTRDIKFALKEWLDINKILEFEVYRDYYSKDDVDSFIDICFNICEDVIAPANEDADTIGLKFIYNKVVTPDSFKKAYRTGNGCSAGAPASRP